MTDEERVTEIATKYVQQAIMYDKNITLEQQEQLLERTKRRVRAERQQAIQVLDEAAEELEKLQWSDLQPAIMQTNSKIRGVQANYIIHFGNFVQTKQKGWIYRPTDEQMMTIVNRYKTKSSCEQVANSLRMKLKPLVLKGATVGYSGQPLEQQESEFMKQLKDDLRQQIKLLRESV